MGVRDRERCGRFQPNGPRPDRSLLIKNLFHVKGGDKEELYRILATKGSPRTRITRGKGPNNTSRQQQLHQKCDDSEAIKAGRWIFCDEQLEIGLVVSGHHP
ncbi:hypothetical protein FRC18_011139 [Serendipita sp. 400]|nr:hypothetical protein FRC18_011139 [Serendipita sp. 400]